MIFTSPHIENFEGHGFHEIVIAKICTSFGASPVAQSKETVCNAGDTGDMGSVPGSEKSPAGGNGNLLQYSCLKNPMDKCAWRVTAHGVAELGTIEHACIQLLGCSKLLYLLMVLHNHRSNANIVIIFRLKIHFN